MKKFLILLGLISVNFAFAEDILQVKPCTVISGQTDDDYNDEYMIDVELINEKADYFTAVQFDLYLPEGMAIVEDAEFNPDRFEGVTKKGSFVADADYAVENKGDHYLVYLYDGDLQTIHGTSGTILSFYYTTTAEFKDKIAPIYIKNVVLKPVEGATVELENTCSYVKVGNPTNATLALEGDIASFVNDALAKETSIGTLDLTKVTASNGTFTYVDGRAVKAPEAAVKGKVAYKRAVSGLASLCLPFAADVKAYTYSSMDGEYAIFNEVANLEAGTAAIVDANIDITVENATIGGVEAQEITSGYYLKGGQLCKVNGTAKIAPLRGCWDIAAGVKGFKFGDADAIMSIDANANEDIYNLNGMKLDKAQRGVNIIGGKKVMK